MSDVFFGEYPYATQSRRMLETCTPVPDSYWAIDGLIPTLNRLRSSYEYDASDEEGLTLLAPGEVFYEGGQLRWDGNSRFVDGSGRPVLLNVAGEDSGQFRAVFAKNFLDEFLFNHGYLYLSLLLGEKFVIDRHYNGLGHSTLATVYTYDGKKRRKRFLRLRDLIAEHGERTRRHAHPSQQ